MTFRPHPAHIIERAVIDVLIGLNQVVEPIDDEAMATTLARNMCAQLTNFASLEVLLAMLGAVGGPKTTEALLDAAELAKQRAAAPFPN